MVDGLQAERQQRQDRQKVNAQLSNELELSSYTPLNQDSSIQGLRSLEISFVPWFSFCECTPSQQRVDGWHS